MISMTVTKLPCVCSENTVTGEVTCNDDCVAGPEINDALIESENVAASRARQVILANNSNRMLTSGTMPLAGYINPGEIVMYTDLEQGDFPSLIVRSEISIKKSRDSYTADLIVQMEREI